jgi:hypothetical protein
VPGKQYHGARRIRYEGSVAQYHFGRFSEADSRHVFGELAEALRNGSHEERLGEFADVLAWLATIANVVGVDLSEAVSRKYGSGCPGCGEFVCICETAGKP